MNPSFQEKCLFYAELAKLLEAGFGVREAAGVMAETGLPATQAAVLEGMLRGLNEGKSISDSLGADGQAVSIFERGVIAAGERGGRMAQAMRHLSSYFGMLASSRREILKGLVHPAIILHLGVFIATVPGAWVRGETNQMHVAAGFVITLLAAYTVVAVAWFVLHAVLKSARVNPAMDRFLRGIPLLGKARENLAMAGFCKIYHIGLLAGLPMRETVRTSAEASHSGSIRAAAARLDRALAEGGPLGPAMLAEDAFPKGFARSYSTGETAGTLDRDLEHWERHYQAEAESSVRFLSSALPRGFYLLALLFVAWKIVGFYQDYYGGLLDTLQQ